MKHHIKLDIDLGDGWMLVEAIYTGGFLGSLVCSYGSEKAIVAVDIDKGVKISIEPPAALITNAILRPIIERMREIRRSGG